MDSERETYRPQPDFGTPAVAGAATVTLNIDGREVSVAIELVEHGGIT